MTPNTKKKKKSIKKATTRKQPKTLNEYEVTLFGVANVVAKVTVEAHSVNEAMAKAKQQQEDGDVNDWEWDGDDTVIEQLFTEPGSVELTEEDIEGVPVDDGEEGYLV
jgi:hypothetical protein